jgi:predicted component of type VI protein secretion system
MSFMVVVTQPGNPGREVHEFEREIVAGRADDCDLVLASPFVSRRHASVALEQDRFIIRDLGSRNGTRVNGQVFRGAVAAEMGSVLAIGTFQLRLDQADVSNDASTIAAMDAVTSRSFLDAGLRVFYVDGNPAIDSLAGREFALLECLAREMPNLVPNTRLADEIWGAGQWDVYMLHNLVRRVRKKIEAVAKRGDEVLVTVPAAGYRLA